MHISEGIYQHGYLICHKYDGYGEFVFYTEARNEQFDERFLSYPLNTYITTPICFCHDDHSLSIQALMVMYQTGIHLQPQI